MTRNKTTAGVLLILVIACATRMLLFAAIAFSNPDGFFTGDAHEYWRIAENIVDHSTYSTDSHPPLMPDHKRTPLYPIYIAVFKWIGLGAASTVFFQILISVATCLIVILLTHALVGDWLPGVLAGGIVALDLPSIALSNALLTETIFTFLLTSSAYCLVSYLRGAQERIALLLGSAALGGLSILCRPIAALLPFFASLLFFVAKRTSLLVVLRRVLVFLMTSFLVVSPWFVRNQIAFGFPIISSIGYHNLLCYRAAGVIAVRDGIARSDAAARLLEEARAEFPGDAEQDPIGLKRHEGEVGASIIAQNMPIYIRNHLVSVFNMFFRPIRSTFDQQLGLSSGSTTLAEWGARYETTLVSRFFAQTSLLTVVLVVIQLPLSFLLWTGFACGIASLLARKESLTLAVILLVVGYFAIMSGGPEAWARFRVPVVPFLAIGGGIGLAEVYERTRKRIGGKK